MELDVKLNGRSLSIPIENPFRIDPAAMRDRIAGFFDGAGRSMEGLDVEGLIPLMVRGVAGCEAGCPADAKSIVERGYRNFRLEYVEGGILTAQAEVAGGGQVVLKLFPDF